MLVITRKKDESVLVGNNILISILKFKNGPEGVTVKLGITAAKEVPIIRTELLRGTPIEETITLQLPGQLTC